MYIRENYNIRSVLQPMYILAHWLCSIVKSNTKWYIRCAEMVSTSTYGASGVWFSSIVLATTPPSSKYDEMMEREDEIIF